MKETVPEKIPTFVARDLQKLPPVTFDHIDVTRLLKDILSIQNELKMIQKKYDGQYATVIQLQELRAEFKDLKKSVTTVPNKFNSNVNTRRGAFCNSSFEYNSGPMGLILGDDSSPTPENDVKEVTNKSDRLNSASVGETSATDTATPNSAACGETSPLSVRNEAVSLTPPESALLVLHSEPITGKTRSPSTNFLPTRPVRGENVNKELNELSADKQNNYPPTTSTKETVQPVMAYLETVLPNLTMAEALTLHKESPGNGWTTVQKRKPSKNIRGSQMGKAPIMANSNFRAAVSLIPLFITNVSKDATEKDIIQYINEKIDVLVIPHKIKMKTERSYSAFKVLVPKNKLSLFLDDCLWPDGITFRRFLAYDKNKSTFSDGKEDSSST